MTYIVKQRIKGRVYVYEVESYWNPEKRQPRQRRRYLGVWDEEKGEIIPKRSQRSIKTTKLYGTLYLLDMLSEEMDLYNILYRTLGNDGIYILGLAMAKLHMPGVSMKNIHYIFEDSFIPEYYGIKEHLDSRRISELFKRIYSNRDGITEFFRHLISMDGNDTVLYDITSISSYSNIIELLEYGYNRDGLNLPQVNLGLVVSRDLNLPLYFKLFPGSVNDVSTLHNLLIEIRNLGVKSCRFILDRGFYSESNIAEMFDHGIDFIIPLPANVKLYKNMISSTNRSISSPENAFRYNSEIFYVHSASVNIGGHDVYAYLLYSKSRESEEHTSFFNRLMDIENVLEGKRVRGDIHELIKNTAGNFSKFFEFSVVDGVLHLSRKIKAISQALNRFGKMILLSSTRLSWDEVLMLYRERDVIEKEFRTLKNDLSVMPMRMRTVESIHGLLFVLFVSLILRFLLLQRCRENGLLEKRSIDDILLEMRKLRAVYIGEEWHLTEVTKKQREIFKKLGLNVPIDIVIKRAGA